MGISEADAEALIVAAEKIVLLLSSSELQTSFSSKEAIYLPVILKNQ